MMPEWYSPGVVTRYNRAMVRWLIPMLPLLRVGDYPPDPLVSGYIDPITKRRIVQAGAKFEKAADIALELDKRIVNAGQDGLDLEQLYMSDPDDVLFMLQHMAIAKGISNEALSQRIRNALYYVSGRDRKKTSYNDYLKARPRGLRR